jgi:8-oxo-dGTP pyrophosphatase MutT (NUDIX family)
MEQKSVLSAGRDRLTAITDEFVRERIARATAGRRGFGTAKDGWQPVDDRAGATGVRGDHSLMPGTQPPPRPLTAAAVLVPLVTRRDELSVLLTQRNAHLADHAGQIAFPGGRVEPGDADAVATALREAREEVGLPAEHVSVIGRLDTYITGTGYEVIPVVGLVRAPYPMRLDPHEVAEAFEVPLAFILDPAHHERHSREVKGRVRNYFVLPYPGHYIWGATAGMLVNLAEVLSGP